MNQVLLVVSGRVSQPAGVDVGLLAQTQTAARLAAGRHGAGPKAISGATFVWGILGFWEQDFKIFHAPV